MNRSTKYDKNSESRNDSESIHLLKARNPAYLESLFIEVNPFLIRVCSANSIFDESAEDIIHQTWETFFLNLEKFEGRSQIRTFICGILFNKIREHRRRIGKTQYEEDSENIFKQTFTPEGWWNVPPQGPDRLLELRQASVLVQKCLEGLSEQQRTAFTLKEVDEESSESICNALGVTVSHLRVVLFRAKEKLRLCLEGHRKLEII